MTVTAILMDLDDTLMPESDPVDEAYAAAARLAERTHGLAAETVERAIRACAEELWQGCPDRDWCQRMGVTSWEALSGPLTDGNPGDAGLPQWAPEFRQRAWRAALERVSIQDDALADDMSETFACRKRSSYRLYPETLPALEDLRHDYRLAMVTNGASSVQRDKVEQTGLGPYFEVIVVSGELGHGKPEPTIFHHTLEQLGIPADQAVMVGNSLKRDIAGARNAGIRSIWISRDDTPPAGPATPDHQAAHVGQLRPLLG